MHKEEEVTAAKLAEYLNAELSGDKDFIIKDISEPENAEEDNIIILSNKKFLQKVLDSKAKVVLTTKEFELKKKILLYTDDIQFSLIKILKFFQKEESLPETSINEKADISLSAKIGKDSKIMEFVVIRENSVIGNNTVIYPNSYIGESVRIGSNVKIYSGVKIYDGTVIGNNVVIHSNTVIGSDGFGYTQKDGKNYKIPQIGNVIIEDDVEIGANSVIDKSTIGSTIIKSGVKIDNLVQIAHNVEIGENTIIASQSGVSGSTKIGKNCILAGQVGIADHVTIEDNIIVGAKSGVPSRTVKSDEKMIFGIPAKPIMRAKRIESSVSHLPELFKEFDELKSKLSKGEQ